MEAWLSGPVPGVVPELIPAAHMLLQAQVELASALSGFPAHLLWRKPAGAASVGFHLRHIAGSADRLLTYARGEALSDAQRAALAAEQTESETDVAGLLQATEAAIDAALQVYRATPAAALHQERPVGRAQLPSTVLGLLYHVAEHTVRHTGQVIVTAKVVRAMEPA